MVNKTENLDKTEIINKINNNLESFIKDYIFFFEENPKALDSIRECRSFLNDLLSEKLDFKEIVDHLYDGIYIADGDGNTLYVNKAYEKMTGISLDEVIGKNVRDIQNSNLFKGAVTPKVLKEKKVISSLGKSLVNQREMLVTGTPVFDQRGKIKLVVVNDRDISDIKRLEAMLSEYKENLEKYSLEIDYLRKSVFTDALIDSKTELIKNIKFFIDEIAPTNAHILIEGESGSGKKVLSNEIFTNSNRNINPFLNLNLIDHNEKELENILLGESMDDGRKKMGILDLAHKGTLLIEEVWAAPEKIQRLLLELISNKAYTKDHMSYISDIRFIFTSTKDLETEVMEANFCDKLYSKIGIIKFKIPPLRERIKDISSIANDLLIKYNRKYQKNISLTKNAIEELEKYSWPGNISELDNCIENFIFSSENDEEFEQMSKTLNYHLKENNDVNILANNPEDDSIIITDVISRYEKSIIEKYLKKYVSVNKVAKKLGLSQPTLWNKCNRLGIDTKKFKND